MAEEKDCVFCKIVKGEIPCEKIYEDEDVLVFLDAFPFMKGQTLIIPKQHLAPWLFGLNEEIYTKLMLIAKRIAKAMDESFDCAKVGMMVEGLEVDHVHIKMFPLGERGFKESRKILDPLPSKEEMKEISEKIRENLR